jgi:hypothetical protein
MLNSRPSGAAGEAWLVWRGNGLPKPIVLDCAKQGQQESATRTTAMYGVEVRLDLADMALLYRAP